MMMLNQTVRHACHRCTVIVLSVTQVVYINGVSCFVIYFAWVFSFEEFLGGIFLSG